MGKTNRVSKQGKRAQGAQRAIQVVDPARARAEELTAGIVDDLHTVAKAFWSIGERLHEMLDKRLYEALGHASFPEYVEQRLDVALTQAYKMVRVVRHYVRSDAEKVGLERAVALIPYAKLVRTDPGLLVREDAPIGDKPVSVASTRDIARAAAERRAALKAHQQRAPAARAKAQETKRLVESVRAVLATARIKRVRIAVSNVRDEIVVRIPRALLVTRFPE